MALLDGKYEVISQQALGDHLTLFQATDHSGQLVSIEWFELSPEQESLFEQHRRLLRRWQREGRAALIDIVSRPGARYAVWPHHHPDKRITSGAAYDELRTAGYAPEAIMLERGTDGEPQLVGLTFLGVEPITPPETTRTATPKRTPLSEAAIAWIITGGAVLGAALLLVVTFFFLTADRLVTVPEGEHRPVQAVLDDLYNAGLQAQALGVESTAPPGTVLRIDPPAGSTLRPMRTVQVSYATPPGEQAQALVPNLVGLDIRGNARAALQEGNWELGETIRVPAAAPAGTVLAQVPSADTSAPGNQPVSVLVSSGPAYPETVLPPLVGLPREDAVQLAKLAGFAEERIVIEEAPGDARTRGRVLSQSLTPHRPINPDLVTLRLLVASGSADHTPLGLVVPDFVGLTEDEAAERAAAWPRVIDVMSTPDLPEGVVMQHPEPRAEVSDITAVTLVVNRHPRVLPEPEANVEIRAIGLRRVPYAWNIEPGILGARAEVWAETVDGKRTLVSTSSVFGGSQVRGTWPTLTPGPVRFELFLNDQPYGDVLVVPED